MRKLLPGLAVAVALAAATAGSTPAGAVVVDLAVESSTSAAPLFDGPIDTQPHEVDGGDGSGPHPCWGSPGAPAAPTATGALDDALRGASITWRGSWDPSFRDFFIDRIGAFSSSAPDRYWSLTVNGRFSAGGCVARVADGDVVRFYYGPLFGAPPEDDPAAPEAPPNDQGKPGPGRSTPDTSRQATALRRLALRATRFLLSTHTDVGGDWAELALALRGRCDPSGAARQLSQRLRALPAPEPAGQDVDSAALAAWALATRGRHAAARRAAAFVRSAQAADGGFPAAPGGDSNAQSTGVALIALRVAGPGPRPTPAPGGPTPLDYLASLARRNGSIAYAPSSSPTPAWTTAQALLGLTAKESLMRLDTLRAQDKELRKGRFAAAAIEERNARAALGWRDHQGGRELSGIGRAGPGARRPLAGAAEGGCRPGQR